MKYLSLFSGAGGGDWAAQYYKGLRPVAYVEYDPKPAAVLQARVNEGWLGQAPVHVMTVAEFTAQHATEGMADVVTGGFPCQPFSHAGARAGTDDPRHLWPQMFRAVKEIRPTWVLGENVPGIISWSEGLVFETVCTDLESEGYEVQPFVLPACGVDAPHKRDRVWFIAYSDSARTRPKYELRAGGGNLFEKRVNNSGITPDSGSPRRESPPPLERGTEYNGINGPCEEGLTSDSYSINGNGTGFNRFTLQQQKQTGLPIPTTDSLSLRLRGQSNGAGVSGEFNKFSPESYWKNFPTQPPICRGDDGLPGRVERYIRDRGSGILTDEEVLQIVQATISKVRKESINGFGNAIVPQVALQIFEAIEDWEILY